MPIYRWRPMRDIESLFEEVNVQQDLATDVYEDNGNVLVEMHLPGITPDKVDISVQDNHLRVTGTREEEKEYGDREYYHQEIKYGSFERVVPLPCSVDSSKAQAEIVNGVLKVLLPKQQSVKGAKIKVKAK
jgi:HSP20 family protein